MKIKLLTQMFGLLIWLQHILPGQSTASRPLTVSLFTVATQLPGGKVLPIHPGLELGTEFRLGRNETSRWFQSAKLGVFHHRLSQTAVMLYSESGFRPGISSRLYAELRLGAGYLHAIPDLQVFSQNDGVYKKSSGLGRPQLMASFATGLGWRLREGSDSPKVFVAMQCFFQMPFIKSYVPVLPNTALHVGTSFPMFRKSKS